jgi:hypothetical protein
MKKVLYILFSLFVVALLLLGLSSRKGNIEVGEISIFGNDSVGSGEILSGSSETGDIFEGDAAVQGNLFGDLGST